MRLYGLYILSLCFPMHNLLFQFAIYFLSGVIFWLIVDYLIYKLSGSKEKIIFTEGISTDVITFTEDYKEILTARLGENNPYYVTPEKSSYYILVQHWTIFDIKKWFELLNNDQDYVISIEFVSKSIEGYPQNKPKIILSNEFVINKHSSPLLISSLISNKLDIFIIFWIKM